jgi:hypothetical protein
VDLTEPGRSIRTSTRNPPAPARSSRRRSATPRGRAAGLQGSGGHLVEVEEFENFLNFNPSDKISYFRKNELKMLRLLSQD